MNKTEIKKILQKYRVKPNRIMGQNFLIDREILKKTLKAANLNENDTVIEIGSGLGILTKELAKKTKKVIAIEKDKQIFEILKGEIKDSNNIELINKDVLDYDFNINKYKVVANIPYYLTSYLIRLLLESKNQPQEITLLVQKELAQRMCSSAPKMNLLSVSVQFFGEPEIISFVPKESFWPEPKVDSAIIKIKNIKKPDNINIKKFFKLVRAGFSSPRKQLANNLSKKLYLNKEEIKKALAECCLNIQARAENLEIRDWICLTILCDHGLENQAGRQCR